LTFFVDRNLVARSFVQILKNADVVIELHEDHFRHNTPDNVWIPQVAAQGWIIVTGDRRIASNPDERQAVIDSNGRSIHLVMGRNGNHKIVATNFVNSIAKIEKFVNQNQPPFLAVLRRPNDKEFAINKPGHITLDTRPISKAR
jgi:hypothetical protein